MKKVAIKERRLQGFCCIEKERLTKMMISERVYHTKTSFTTIIPKCTEVDHDVRSSTHNLLFDSFVYFQNPGENEHSSNIIPRTMCHTAAFPPFTLSLP